MNKVSLLKYVRKKNGIDEALYEHIRYTLDSHVYYYGAHFKTPHEKNGKGKREQELKAWLRKMYVYYKYFTKKRDHSKPAVVSNAYFNFNEELNKSEYHVLQPCWSVRKGKGQLLGNYNIYHEAERIKTKFQKADFNYLISSPFLEEISGFKKMLREVFVQEDVKALFVPNDVSLFENLSISLFKELNRPSFTFLHGLPGRYNLIDENRSDYLIVWGPRIKQHYVDTGFSPEKIFVSGHPYYSNTSSRTLRFGLENILLLARMGVGSPHSDGVNLFDRGNLIVYLLSVQAVLEKMGVKKVRLRFHPSANPDWHYKFIDRSFFELDTQPLQASLNNASLVIGPTSTVFLEALYAGVNYMIFEPSEDDKLSLLNEELAPPFNGSDERIPVAKSEDELERNLKDKVKVDVSVLNEYIKTPFDITFLKELI